LAFAFALSFACLSGAAGAAAPQVAAGGWHTLALKADGTLWAWGENDFGQLGLGVTGGTHRVPQQVGTASDWKTIAGGREHSFAIKNDGSLWAWGWNQYGQLGLGTGDTTNRSVPTRVGTDTDWVAVASGFWSTAALKSNGTLWTWGRNNVGQLGLGTTDGNPHPVPAQVVGFSDWSRIAIQPSSGEFVFATRGAGALYSWGYNAYGQLGLGVGDTANRSAPTLVSGLYTWKAIALGDAHSAVVRSDGVLFCGGRNDYGQRGDADPANYGALLQVGAATDWAWTCGARHESYAVKTNGSVWATGYNGYGSLGVGDWTDRWTFTALSDAGPWQQLSGGTHFVVAVKPDGSVWTWGLNDYGQLGLNDLTNRNVPTRVGLNLKTTDATAPGTTASALPAANAKGWNKTKPVTVTFTATDDLSGVAYTEYSTNGGGAWTRGGSCAVSAEGETVVQYRSADNAGNVEAAKSVTVRIDTVRPKPTALANATVKKGKKAGLRFKVADTSCTTCTATIKIKNGKGKVVKTFSKSCKTNTNMVYSFTCKLAKGTYKWYVYATDPAGNTQAKASSKKLTVR
jgi:alpha-tubulin suppressor-like RCC1 family protein